MTAYILKRLAQTVVTAMFVTVIVFALARLTGDPTVLLLPTEATQADRDFFRTQLGLDKPLHEQYLTFLGNVVKGDLGTSFRHRVPALDLILAKLPATLELALASMLLATAIALPTGIIAAVRRGSWADRLVRWFATLGQAMPTFWLGLMLILIFSVTFNLFPTSGRGGLHQLILPAVTLGWYSAAAIARLTRSSMIEVMQSDFIKFERLSGLPEWRIVAKHALKNASIPIITYMALQFGVLLSGAVVTERVFAWPGVGQLTVDAIMERDYPVVQAAVLITAFLFLLINLAVDLLYSWLDPRIRY